MTSQQASAVAEGRSTRPNFTVPDGACDGHVHLFGPHDQFPLAADRLYTPGPVSPADLLAHQAELGLQRAVVVHATPQGEEPTYLLHALKALPTILRGVAPVKDYLLADLHAMRRTGVRGLRLNLETHAIRDPGVSAVQVASAARQAASAGLHLQLHASIDVLSGIASTIAALPCLLVIDHFGRIDPARGPSDAGVRLLCELVSSGRAYIKLSAFHRIARQADFSDLGPIVRALADAGGDRLIWGSDWPHPQRPAQGRSVSDAIDPYRHEDDGLCLNRLAKWLGDPRVVEKVLVDNPQVLFEF